jgi:putative oxidoreductase
MVILLEFFGSLLVLVGFGSRLLAASFLVLVIAIVFSSHAQYGFFMNWFGSQAGEGYEYFLLYAGLCIALTINGSGRFSMDGMLTDKFRLSTNL